MHETEFKTENFKQKQFYPQKHGRFELNPGHNRIMLSKRIFLLIKGK